MVSHAQLVPVILNPRIVVHGAGTLPVAPLVTVASFGTREKENRLVTVEGVVQRADTTQNGVALVVRISQGSTPIDVYCQAYSGAVGDELDRRVGVVGVATSDLDVELKPVRRTLWSVSWANTVHLDPVRSPLSAPLVTSASLLGMPADRLSERRVRIREDDWKPPERRAHSAFRTAPVRSTSGSVSPATYVSATTSKWRAFLTATLVVFIWTSASTLADNIAAGRGDEPNSG